jgi:hypothetical protein
MAGFIVAASDVGQTRKREDEVASRAFLECGHLRGWYAGDACLNLPRLQSEIPLLMTKNYNAEMRPQSPRRRKTAPSSSTIVSNIFFLLDNLQPVRFSNFLI